MDNDPEILNMFLPELHPTLVNPVMFINRNVDDYRLVKCYTDKSERMTHILTRSDFDKDFN